MLELLMGAGKIQESCQPVVPSPGGWWERLHQGNWRIYNKEIGTSSHLGSLVPRATLLDGQDQEEQEPLRSCPGLLRGPFICFTNTMLYRSQITRLLSHRTKVTPTDAELLPALSLRSTAKVGQNLFEGTDIKGSGEVQASGACWWSNSSSSKTEWAKVSVAHWQPQGLGPCCPKL